MFNISKYIHHSLCVILWLVKVMTLLYGWFRKEWYPQIIHLTGFSIINHPFWGTPIFGNPHILLLHIWGTLISLRKTPSWPPQLPVLIGESIACGLWLLVFRASDATQCKLRTLGPTQPVTNQCYREYHYRPYHNNPYQSIQNLPRNASNMHYEFKLLGVF